MVIFYFSKPDPYLRMNIDNAKKSLLPMVVWRFISQHVNFSRSSLYEPSGFKSSFEIFYPSPLELCLTDDRAVRKVIGSKIIYYSQHYLSHLSRPKYTISETRTGYLVVLTAVIRNLSRSDLGEYKCFANSGVGAAESGDVVIHGKLIVAYLHA